ncbi:hypothetical protein D1115_16210 [Vibrio alfacsensis]|uniref:Uncharacterized protein n=1 Tax=Vibrio alfacsensis TaxID=1074311 RepID=A0ABM6YY79_9VIBR|nr:hypothetical protein [Vibrio alfacsensis]AXY02581.1 hypothetical protein D1115_16210 [Vibrio alfacsensis]
MADLKLDFGAFEQKGVHAQKVRISKSNVNALLALRQQSADSNDTDEAHLADITNSISKHGYWPHEMIMVDAHKRKIIDGWMRATATGKIIASGLKTSVDVMIVLCDGSMSNMKMNATRGKSLQDLERIVKSWKFNYPAGRRSRLTRQLIDSARFVALSKDFDFEKFRTKDNTHSLLPHIERNEERYYWSVELVMKMFNEQGLDADDYQFSHWIAAVYRHGDQHYETMKKLFFSDARRAGDCWEALERYNTFSELLQNIEDFCQPSFSAQQVVK